MECCLQGALYATCLPHRPRLLPSAAVAHPVAQGRAPGEAVGGCRGVEVDPGSGRSTQGPENRSAGGRTSVLQAGWPARRPALRASAVGTQTLFPVPSSPARLRPCLVLAPWLAPDQAAGSGGRGPEVGSRGQSAVVCWACDHLLTGPLSPWVIIGANPSLSGSDGERDSRYESALANQMNCHHLSRTQCYLVS